MGRIYHTPMYNDDCHTCKMCDDEPAVYNGVCALCLMEDEPAEESGVKRGRPAPRKHDEGGEY